MKKCFLVTGSSIKNFRCHDYTMLTTTPCWRLHHVDDYTMLLEHYMNSDICSGFKYSTIVVCHLFPHDYLEYIFLTTTCIVIGTTYYYCTRSDIFSRFFEHMHHNMSPVFSEAISFHTCASYNVLNGSKKCLMGNISFVLYGFLISYITLSVCFETRKTHIVWMKICFRSSRKSWRNSSSLRK